MRKKEQRLWDRMRKALSGSVRMERVENLVSVGRPDVDCLVDGFFTPVELKSVCRLPARRFTAVLGDKDGLSIDQRNWHLDWQRHGGKSLIIIGVADLTNRLYAVPGKYHDDVNGMTTVELLRFCHSWNGVLALLRRKEIF